MEIEEGVKMGENPSLGPVVVQVGSRVVPLKRKRDPLLDELIKIRLVLEHIDGNINYLTRDRWWTRVWRRILSWAA